MIPINPYDVVLDEEELEIEADYAAGLYKQVDNFEEEKDKLQKYARNTVARTQKLSDLSKEISESSKTTLN